jgi:ubiquinone/menaquinone biosynthesis C-methylase UbiE
VPVDPVAEQGFTEALTYERGRPGYAPAAVARVAEELGVGPESRVLDLAAGTGKLGRAFAPLAGALVAVEPSAPMREVLARTVPEAEILDGEAEQLPLPDGSIDAIVVGEAFHWFATPAAVAEMARVLRPGGGLALFWNLEAATEPPWPDELRALVREPFEATVPDIRRYRSSRWRDAFDAAPFAPLQSDAAEHRHQLDREGFVAQIASWSYIAVLPEPRRSALLARAAELAPAQSTTTFRTEFHWTRRP